MKNEIKNTNAVETSVQQPAVAKKRGRKKKSELVDDINVMSNMMHDLIALEKVYSMTFGDRIKEYNKKPKAVEKDQAASELLVHLGKSMPHGAMYSTMHSATGVKATIYFRSINDAVTYCDLLSIKKVDVDTVAKSIVTNEEGALCLSGVAMPVARAIGYWWYINNKAVNSNDELVSYAFNKLEKYDAFWSGAAQAKRLLEKHTTVTEVKTERRRGRKAAELEDRNFVENVVNAA